MTVTIHIPAALRAECHGASELSVSARTVREVLEQLERTWPSLYRGICDETGSLRRHVNLFVNDAYVHQRDGFDTVLEPGDVIAIFPAVSGG